MGSSLTEQARIGRAGVHALGLAALLGTLMQSLVVPVLGTLPDALGTTPAAAGWLVTAMLITSAAATGPAGRLADRYGERIVILGCTAALIAGSVLAAVSDTLAPVIVGRALQGLALAAVPLTMSAVREPDPARTHRAQSVLSTYVGVGGALGYLTSAAVAEHLGWRALFWTSAALGALTFGLLHRGLPHRTGPVAARTRPDVLGVVGLGLTLVLVQLTANRASTGAWSPGTAAGAGAVALVLLVVWVRHELGHPSPLVDVRAAAGRASALVTGSTLLLGAAMYVGLLTLPQLLQAPDGYALSMTTSGLWLMPASIAATLTPALGARLSIRYGPRTTLVVATATQLTGYLVLAVAHTRPAGVVIGTVLTYAAFSLGYAATPVLAMAEAAVGRTAGAAALNALARTVGITASGAVVTAWLASTTAPGASSPSPAGFAHVLVLGAVLAAGALTCAVVLSRTADH